MLTSLISRVIILIFAILHPAYKSYKSLRNKKQTEIVTWLMYWIVFALYTSVETVTDVILCWLPFYYELKIVFVLWMSLPVTRGYSLIFRKFIHPELLKHEPEIDEIIERVRETGYNALLEFGTKGINLAATTVLSTAVKGQELLYSRSRSLVDLSSSPRRMIDSGASNDFTDDATLAGFVGSISGQGDSPSTVPRFTSDGGRYDTGTFPRRRHKATELQILPEEDSSIKSDQQQNETKRDKHNISQVYLSALSQRESPKRPMLTSFLRSQSDASDARLHSKPPIYRSYNE